MTEAIEKGLLERWVSEATERMARRMGCTFVKNERWAEMFPDAALTGNPVEGDGE